MGFCLSFEPRRERQRRTSGRGQATSTGPELRLRSSSNLQTTRSLICVRPRVADPSGLPLACGRPDGTGRPWAFPRASHPADQEPDDARRGGDRPSSTDLELPAQHHIGSILQSGSSLDTCDLASHVRKRQSASPGLLPATLLLLPRSGSTAAHVRARVALSLIVHCCSRLRPSHAPDVARAARWLGRALTVALAEGAGSRSAEA